MLLVGNTVNTTADHTPAWETHAGCICVFGEWRGNTSPRPWRREKAVTYSEYSTLAPRWQVLGASTWARGMHTHTHTHSFLSAPTTGSWGFGSISTQKSLNISIIHNMFIDMVIDNHAARCTDVPPSRVCARMHVKLYDFSNHNCHLINLFGSL